MSSPFILAAVNSSPSGALVVFILYMLAVMAMAILSHKVLQKKAFLSEYFLGSRSLGVWAFALTFAATSASGGSFLGFPAKVYVHGWVVALWIGGYMVVPILVMGLLGKRINQISRKTGAITIPDLLRDRFASAGLGGLSTFLLVFFMTFNLIAQFKAGSVILQSLLHDVPAYHTATSFAASIFQHIPYLRGAESPGYLLCLLTFALGVIIYTTYGGFRAVVWTDVLQGVVMIGGVMLLLPMAIYFAGGLGNTTRQMAEMTPPVHVTASVRPRSLSDQIRVIPAGTWLVFVDSWEKESLYRTASRAVVPPGERYAVLTLGQTNLVDDEIPAIAMESNIEISSVNVNREFFIDGPIEKEKHAYGDHLKNTYLIGPGPSRDNELGFLPLSLAVSFFFMWTFSSTGQPGNMVRQMAFKGSKTLRYGILTLCFYFSAIYFPLILIFCCARVLLPGWEIEPDRIMPEMAKVVTSKAGIPWLAGLLVAAPFAAVMSTVDSFLLISSSAVVRDIYQRNMNPQASEKTMKRLTYGVTLAIGSAAMLAAVNPPKYLQDIIIFTGSGLSTSFLVPVAASLYWPRFNRQGAMASMLGGFLSYVALYGGGYLLFGKMKALQPGNFHPFMIAMGVSLLAGVLITLVTPKPEEELTDKFFYVKS